MVVATAAAFLLQAWWVRSWVLDDAFIFFRYAENWALGHGPVYNAGAEAVEGYTSFLWVVLLDFVWSITGLPPPVAANRLGLLFGFRSLCVTARMVWLLPLDARLSRYRVALLATVLAGVVTNATFLTWTSSGLETSLFNFLLLGWVFSALFLQRGSPGWTFGLTASAALLVLTRPEGLLMVGAS